MTATFKNALKSATAILLVGSVFAGTISAPSVKAEDIPVACPGKNQTLHKSIRIKGLNIFYREAGPKDAPVILLLHGFPTSSKMFAEMMDDLSDEFHLIAPDYPGFVNSSMPLVDEFEYSFDNLAVVINNFITAKKLDHYALYVMDYGAPIGYRIALNHPERITGLIVQNGNAYVEGLGEFWNPIKTYWADRTDKNAEPLKGFLNLEGTKWQYLHGTRNPEVIKPENWIVDQYFMDRPGNKEIQLELFYSYSTNPPLYPEWQEYFRQYQPPTLVVWGKNDYIFPPEGAYPYKRDLTNIEFHFLDTGHFALEEDGEFITAEIRNFMKRQQD